MPSLGHFRPEEKPLADLADQVPGAGGLYYDDDGNLVVLVTKSMEGQSASRAAAKMRIDGRLIPTDKGAGKSRGVRVLEARYTLRQLAEWRDLAFGILTNESYPVVSLDLDEKRNRVAIGVERSFGEDSRKRLFGELLRAGIDTAGVLLDSRGPAGFDVAEGKTAASTALSSTSALLTPPPTIEYTFTDPMPGGIQIHWFGTNGLRRCSLGFVAQRSGINGMVTNSHCSQTIYQLEGTPFFQLYPRYVGYESVDPPSYTCGIRDCRESDALFVRIDTAQIGLGLIARTYPPALGGLSAGDGSLVIDQSSPYLIVTGEAGYGITASTIHKMGHETGWTKGGITSTCVDHWIELDDVTTCSHEADYVADGGDSGGTIFYFEDDGIGSPNQLRVHIAGVHSGRALYLLSDRARFSPLSRIKTNLGALNIIRPATLTTPDVTPSVVSGNAQLSWPAVSGAAQYEVFVQDYQWQCDFDCYFSGYPITRHVVTGTTFTDTRSFLSVFSGTPVGNYSRYYVRAFNGPAVSYSGPTPWMYFYRL